MCWLGAAIGGHIMSFVFQEVLVFDRAAVFVCQSEGKMLPFETLF